VIYLPSYTADHTIQTTEPPLLVDVLRRLLATTRAAPDPRRTRADIDWP
jgi:hypothetical protein